MLFCDKIFNKGSRTDQDFSQRALIIGFGPVHCDDSWCIALLSTIVGGISPASYPQGEQPSSHSSWLCRPCLARTARGLKLISHGGGSLLTQGINLFPLICRLRGGIHRCLLAIKCLINYVTKYGFAAFGWYRIVVGLIIIICGLCGVDMQMVD